MKQRLYSIDAIRSLAMVLVIIVHTKGYFFSSDNSPLIFCLLKVLGTVGVPLFVILTGYLMIHRNYEADDYLKNFISNNLIPLFVAYEIWNIVWNIFRYTHLIDEPKKWIDVLFAALFMGDTQSALWYLPMSIALYLGLPIVSVICHRIIQLNYQKILFIFLLLSGTIIPSISDLFMLAGKNLNIHSVFNMNIFGASVWGESAWMIYLLSGHAIYKGKLKIIKTYVLVTLGVLLPFGIMYSLELTGKSVQNYNFILVILLSVSLFEILTRIEFFLQKHSILQKFFAKISEISFSVYMLHIFIAGVVYHFLESSGILLLFEKSYGSVLYDIQYIIFIISIISIIQFIVLILKRNNFIRRYVLLMK